MGGGKRLKVEERRCWSREIRIRRSINFIVVVLESPNSLGDDDRGT